MAFCEKLKTDIRRLAHFQCCLCKAIGVEIHHIIPEEEGGPDTVENAAPLCPSCHETYGANPSKRKFIREARDFWYEICEKRYTPDTAEFDEIKDILQYTASRDDIIGLKNELLNAIKSIPTSTHALQTGKNEKTESEETDSFNECTADDVLISLYSYNSQRKISNFDLLFSDVVWPDEELLRYRDTFLRRFGEMAAKKICIESLDELGFDLQKGFTEPQLQKLLHYIHVKVMLFFMLSEGMIKPGFNKHGELMWASNVAINEERDIF